MGRAPTYLAVTNQPVTQIYRKPWHIRLAPAGEPKNGGQVKVLCGVIMLQANFQVVGTKWMLENRLPFCSDCLLEYASQQGAP